MVNKKAAKSSDEQSRISEQWGEGTSGLQHLKMKFAHTHKETVRQDIKKSKWLKHKADDDMSSFPSSGKRKLFLEESHEASKIE